jgi:hypothetical protein
MSALRPYRSTARSSKRLTVAHAEKKSISIQQRLAASSLAAVLSVGCVADVAVANEFDVRTLNRPLRAKWPHWTFNDQPLSFQCICNRNHLASWFSVRVSCLVSPREVNVALRSCATHCRLCRSEHRESQLRVGVGIVFAQTA